jgi:hypothetical protein
MAEVPGSTPGGGSGPNPVPAAVVRLDAPWPPATEGDRSTRAAGRFRPVWPAECNGGLTERKGARLLSDGRGQPRQRSIRCPSALEGMPRWLGHPVSKTGTRFCRGGSTPLPSALAQWCNGSTPGLQLGGCRIKTDLRHTPSSDKGSPPGSQPGSRGSVPRGGTGVVPVAAHQCGVAQRKSGWPLPTVVGGSMPSSAALAP